MNLFKVKNIKMSFFSFLFLLFLVGKVGVCQNSFTMEVYAPNIVAVGEHFRITFSLNQEITQFNPPSAEGFQILAGPEQSSSSQISVINGKTTHNRQVSISYILIAQQPGEYTIGEATAKDKDGRTASSRSFTIKVVKQDQPNDASAGGEGSAASKSKADEVLLTLNLSKSSVYPGEHVIATLKLLFRASVANLQNLKVPPFDGFFTQEIEVPNNTKPQRETYNGLIYESIVLKKVLLYPQQKSGNIRIEPYELDAIVQKRKASRDIFDSFFGGDIEQYRLSLKSTHKTVTIKPFPTGAPQLFKGAVGAFKLGSTLSRKSVKIHEGLALSVTLSGAGNLKLTTIERPKFPSDFEVYEPSVKENITVNQLGSNGTKTFEYQMIARSPGTFTIPSVEFAYFDPSAGSYKILRTKEHVITVEKDPNAMQSPVSTTIPFNTQKEISVLGSDIVFIKTDIPSFTRQGQRFFGTPIFYFSYISISLFFLILLWSFKHYKEQHSNISLQKRMKAKRNASRRLKKAKKYLQGTETSLFYEELMHALWGYCSDKLGIPTSELSREKLVEILNQKNMESDIISQVTQVIDECEFARFGYGSDTDTKHQVFRHAIAVINALEQIK